MVNIICLISEQSDYLVVGGHFPSLIKEGSNKKRGVAKCKTVEIVNLCTKSPDFSSI